MKRLKDMSIQSKIIMIGLTVAAMPVVLMFLLINFQKDRVTKLFGQQFYNQAEQSMTNSAKDVFTLCESQHEAILQMLTSNMNIAHDIVKRKGIKLLTDKVNWAAMNQETQVPVSASLPKLAIDNQWIGQNSSKEVYTPVVDDVAKMVGGTCTIFQRMNAQGDMLRVATNVIKKDGKRAIGTYIPAVGADGKPNAVVSTVMGGNAYYGRAFVVDSWYVTGYEPIRDAGGQVIGMLYVGIKQENATNLRQAIMSIVIGKTGYVAVVGGSGNDKGRYIISAGGKRDGESILEAKDSTGKFFIKGMIDKAVEAKGKVVLDSYLWQNKDDKAPREKLTAAIYFEPWDWGIFATSYKDEIIGEVTAKSEAAMKTLMWSALFSGVIVLIFGAIAYLEALLFAIRSVPLLIAVLPL